jgi:hypothetical protein
MQSCCWLQIVEVKGQDAYVKVYSVHSNGKTEAVKMKFSKEQVMQWLQPKEKDMTQQQYTAYLFDRV